MKIMMFAAVDVGSYELVMKLFQLSPKDGMTEVECVRSRLDLHPGSYGEGRLAFEDIELLCRRLQEFAGIMKSYKVSAYRITARSTIRELKNLEIILKQIRDRTGMVVEVLSNGEQRLLNYKSVVAREGVFGKLIEKSTGIIDVGEGNTQISLFRKDCLVSTQNVSIGVLRTAGQMTRWQSQTDDYSAVLEEYINNDLEPYRKLFMNNVSVKNIIIVGRFFNSIIRVLTNEGQKEYITRDDYLRAYDDLRKKSSKELANYFGWQGPEDLLLPALTLYKCLIEMMGGQRIWGPELYLCDGLAYDYAVAHRYVKARHDFQNDVLAAGRMLADRYRCDGDRIAAAESAALTIFDCISRQYGFTERHRVLLRLAVTVQDCGKYVSLAGSDDCCYEIIRSSPIIGLSHVEQEMVANVVRFRTDPVPPYGRLADRFTREEYVIITGLSAILRLANAVDCSSKKKFDHISIARRGGDMVITIDSLADLTLELGMLSDQKDFFQEVFGIRLEVRQRRKY